MKVKITILLILFVHVGFAQESKVWTLQECVNYAVENNITVKQAQLDKDISIEDLKAAKWNFAPNLNANASQNYNFGSSITASGARASADFRSNSFGINSSINLFDGFANIQGLKQAQIGIEVQEAAISKIKNDISLNVVNMYLQILFAEEQLKVASSQVEISASNVERIKELVNAGALAEGDLFNAKSNYATDNQNLIVNQNNLTIAKLRLAQLLQLNTDVIEVEPMEVSINNQTILGNDVQAIYEKANAAFPEIKLAELNISSAEKSIALSKANYYPSLTMSLGMNTIYQHRQGQADFSPFLFSDQIDNNLGQSIIFSLNVPIFSRYQFRSNVNKAKVNYQKITLNLESEQLRLKETIQSAYTDARSASKAYDAASFSVEAQAKAFEYSQERFNSGAINSFDFNQSKNNLVNAQSQLIQSKYDFMFKLKVLEFYFGEPIFK